MSLWDALTPAADTQDIQAGGQGFLDNLGDAATAGVTGAVLSGFNSIYNTAAAGANALGANVEENNTYNQLADIDDNWAKYYQEHKNPIDIAGFIGTSLIPGTLGIKALNAVRAGNAANVFGRALGFARTQQASYLDAALTELATEGGTIFSRINTNKLAAMAWGVADQTLTAAAFETGVALTMKQSPLLSDDSWWDLTKSGLVNAAFGGVVGGGIDSIFLHRGLKDAVQSLDTKAMPYKYQSDFKSFNLAAGDKAFNFVDSLLQLPKDVLEADKTLPVSFKLGAGPINRNLDIGGYLNSTLTGAKNRAVLDFESSVRAIADTDPEASAGLSQLALNRYRELSASGATADEIRSGLGDILFGLKSFRPATENLPTPSTDLWYFNKKVDVSKITDVDSWKKQLVDNTPFPDNAYTKPYQFLGSPQELQDAFTDAAKIGGKDSAYPLLKDAWADGKHVAVMPDGSYRVNDSSPLWKRVDDPVYDSTRFLNTHTGAITGDTVLTAADRVPVGTSISKGIQSDGVYLPIRTGNKVSSKYISMKDFRADGDVEYFTARHAWAAKLPDAKLPDNIEVTDFSLMDRLRTADPATLERINISSGEHDLGAASDLNLESTIKNAKLSKAQELLSDAFDSGETLDTRALGYQLNTDPVWLENAVASRFNSNMSGTSYINGKSITNLDGLSRDLSDYLRRENGLAEYDRPSQFTDLGIITPDMGWQEKRNIIMDVTAKNGGEFVTGELAWRYRVQAAVAVTKDASAAVLGPEKFAMLPDLAQDAAKLADSLGAGASFVASSNASYGEVLKLWAQTSGKLVHQWIDERLKGVVDSFSTVAVRLRADKEAAAELGIVTNMLRATEDKYIWDPLNPKRLMLRDLAGMSEQKLYDAVASAQAAGKRPYIDIDNDLTAQFLGVHSSLNSERINKRTVLWNARGMTTNMDPEVVYAPPVDTTYFKNFAFVRGGPEGKAFGTSEVSMIFGRDAGELSKRMAIAKNAGFEVITKDQNEAWFKAKDLYDFDLTINEPRINPELRRTGALSTPYPEVRAENLIEDYMRWHQNQSSRLVRDAVETNYAQQITELKKLGQSYVEEATSRFSGTLRSSKSEVADPYDDYVKTALDVSKRSEYTFFHQANEFVDALGTRAYQMLQQTFGDATKGMVSWEDANTIAGKYGIAGPYSDQHAFELMNAPRDRSLFKEYISKANMLLANFVLRFDFANSLINIVSTPLTLGTEMASIRSLAAKDSALTGKLNQLTSVAMPDGSGIAVPSTKKLLFNAVGNFFGPDKEELLSRYVANGDVKTTLNLYHSFIDDLQMRADFKPFKDGVDRAFNKVGELTGNNWAEQFTRFISADVMRQLSDPLVDAGKLTLKEQNAYISTFVNRVQGNYVSSQRPIIFQGVLGSAVGLFQTYSFNLLQQLFRHIEDRNTKAVATMFGLQTGLFGLNGTPMFDAINTNIIGNSSINARNHTDAYSLAPTALGKPLGDWLMYGTVSAFPAFGDKWPSLYSRGDINPRQMSIIPLTPAQVPAIDASMRVVTNLADIGSKLINGANITQTLLQGLEHNGVNRPLAGMAQVLAGQSTTSQGGLISASSDFNLIANAARVAGAKPLDESLALNELFRNKAYEAADKDRTQHLGERVKSYLYKNQMPPDDVMDGFMKDYAAIGGRPENFNSALQGWMKDANTSVVEKMRSKLHSSYGQRLNEVMGGTPLSDYRNQTPASGGAPAPAAATPADDPFGMSQPTQ